jgi:hypothetical protein
VGHDLIHVRAKQNCFFMTNIGRYLSSEPNNFYYDGSKEKGKGQEDKEETLIFL